MINILVPAWRVSSDLITNKNLGSLNTKKIDFRNFSRGSRVCQLWSHVNPAVEKRWQRALPLQCLWFVVTITTTIILPLFHTNLTTFAMLAVGWHHCHFHSLSKYLTPTLILLVVGSHHYCVPTIFLSLIHILTNQVSMSQASITK